MAPPVINATTLDAPAENVAEFESSKILAFNGTIAAFTQDAVENLFTNGGKFDGVKTADYVSHLPGVRAAALTVGDETQTCGDIPQNFNPVQTRDAACNLFQSLADPSTQAGRDTTQNVTLHHDGFSSTWFKQGNVRLGVLHPQRALGEDVHNKVALVVEEVARLGGK